MARRREQEYDLIVTETELTAQRGARVGVDRREALRVDRRVDQFHAVRRHPVQLDHLAAHQRRMCHHAVRASILRTLQVDLPLVGAARCRAARAEIAAMGAAADGDIGAAHAVAADQHFVRGTARLQPPREVAVAQLAGQPRHHDPVRDNAGRLCHAGVEAARVDRHLGAGAACHGPADVERIAFQAAASAEAIAGDANFHRCME
ncbi:hypothetical protein D3C72_1157610 [compost metagenome]